MTQAVEPDLTQPVAMNVLSERTLAIADEAFDAIALCANHDTGLNLELSPRGYRYFLDAAATMHTEISI